MNNEEKATALDVMLHTAGWQIYIDEVIGTDKDINKGKWGRVLISLSKKKKENTLDYAKGILEGLEYARNEINDYIKQLKGNNQNP